MFQFAYPYYFYFLTALPVFFLLFWLFNNWKRKSIQKFGEYDLVRRLMPDLSNRRTTFRFLLINIAYILLVFSLARPQIGSKLEKVKRKGVDIMILMDVSNSMLAEDIQPNRLDRAKQSVSKLIDRLDSDRIGIVVFAGKAFTQLPITTDFGAAKMFLETINPNLVDAQGTAIGKALELGVQSFNKDKKNGKAIIIITDGENHEDDAIEQAKAVAKEDIIVFTVGMGSPEGAPIPIYRNTNIKDYKKDKDGNTVITQLNENMLQQIAAAGRGKYFRASNSNLWQKGLFVEINKMESSEIESNIFSDYEDRFQFFVGVALLFLIAEILISERKSKLWEKLNPFKKT